jgi:hypothetical protein
LNAETYFLSKLSGFDSIRLEALPELRFAMPFEPDCELSDAMMLFSLSQCPGPLGMDNDSLLFVLNPKVSFTRSPDPKSIDGRIEETQ